MKNLRMQGIWQKLGGPSARSLLQMTKPVVHPLFLSTQLGRSLGFLAQSLSLPLFEKALFGTAPAFEDKEYLKNFPEILKELYELLKKDSQRFEDGVYPPMAFLEQSYPWRLDRLAQVLIDGYQVGKRRKSKKHHEFSKELEPLLAETPEYYRRNFHYQTDGYFSQQSAELYDYQVEVLFAGGADPMRRLLLVPLGQHFSGVESKPGQGRIRILELGCGTGSLTKFLVQLLPKAKFTCVDLSEAYLWKARKNLESFSSIEFLQADAAHLPFQEQSYDAVVSCFLFHELPAAERKKVISEAHRVLKPGGFFGFIDSLQMGDKPNLDFALKRFPMNFHEPFYKNYIESPMEKVVLDQPFTNLVAETGYFSKCVSAIRV